jgi:hypothetical protein
VNGFHNFQAGIGKAILTSLEIDNQQFIYRASVRTFRTDETYFKFRPNSPWAISTEKNIAYIRNANMYERDSDGKWS